MNEKSLKLFKELALTRRSIRRYDTRPVPDELVQEILTMTIWAPSAHNRQPWRFVVISTTEHKKKLAQNMGIRLRADLMADNVPEENIQQDVSRSYERITTAPILICLCMSMADMDAYPDEQRQRNERVMALQSTAAAGQNLLLATHAAGLGACWMCAPLFCPDVVQHTLELPSDWEPQALITLGYPAETRNRSRQALETRTLWR
jgi:F420 biosynthesis protein FbiB-like protein